MPTYMRTEQKAREYVMETKEALPKLLSFHKYDGSWDAPHFEWTADGQDGEI